MLVTVAVAWLVLAPRLTVKMGVTEKEVKRILGKRGADSVFIDGKRLATGGKVWVRRAGALDIEFDESGRVTSIERHELESGPWERILDWFRF